MCEKLEEFNMPDTTEVDREYLYKLETSYLYYKKAIELIKDELDNDPRLAIEDIEEIIRELEDEIYKI